MNGAHTQSNDPPSFPTRIGLFTQVPLVIAVKDLKIDAGRLGESLDEWGRGKTGNAEDVGNHEDHTQWTGPTEPTRAFGCRVWFISRIWRIQGEDEE
jgi:hypothetical protein